MTTVPDTERQVPVDVERRAPYPGQRYKHGWIPIGDVDLDDDESEPEPDYEVTGRFKVDVDSVVSAFTELAVDDDGETHRYRRVGLGDRQDDDPRDGLVISSPAAARGLADAVDALIGHTRTAQPAGSHDWDDGPGVVGTATSGGLHLRSYLDRNGDLVNEGGRFITLADTEAGADWDGAEHSYEHSEAAKLSDALRQAADSLESASRARTNEESGGGGGGKTLHEPAGSPKGGQFTANPSGASKTTSKPTSKPKPKITTTYKPIIPVAAKKGPMKLGGDNDPQQVKQLQALLGALGLGTPPTDGSFDSRTEDAVKEAQRRLRLKPTGRASTALLNKLTSAYALSPCIKRSADEEHNFELFRAAVVRGDFDDPEEDSEGRPLVNDIERCCPDVYDDESHVFRREWDLDGIDIIRGGAGGGRTVEAYATVFDKPTEVNDQHGHYMETIHRAAFDDALRGGIGRVSCYYNHGMDIHGKPSDTFSIPIGAPVEVKPDGKGLRTITRFNDGPVEDRILEAIRNQAIRAYSFRGPIRKSDPPRVRKVRSGEALPTVTRMALGLTEYGPTPAPYYVDAGILAVRSRLASLDEEKWDRLFRLLAASTPEDQDAVRTALSATPTEGLGAEDQPDEALRSAITQADVRRKIAVWKITGGVTS